MKVRDLMSAPVLTVTPDTPVRSVLDAMVDHRVGGVPVVGADGDLVGIVTQADLVSRQAYPGPPRRRLAMAWEGLLGWDTRWMAKAPGTTAAQVMTRLVVTASPDEDVTSAARTMLRQRIKRLPVVDGGRLVGILSRTDVLRVLVDVGEDAPSPAG